MDYTAKINALTALINHPKTGEGEKAAAARMLERMRAKAEADGQDTSTRTWGYQLPEVAYGSKRTGYIPLKEVAALIREDIKMARKIGKTAAKAGGVAIADPIADAPDDFKFGVRMAPRGSSLYITIKNVPADWWVDEAPYWDDKAPTRKAAGPRLQALADALYAIAWSYNYDGSDAQVDYFNRGFYEHVEADGHGESEYLRTISKNPRRY